MATKNLNADWKTWYKEHLITLEEAAKLVEPGDVFYLGQATTIPYAFLDELHAHKERYHDVTFWYNVMNVPANMLFDSDTRNHFRLLNLFQLPLDRIAYDDHIVDVLGATYDTYHACLQEYGCNGYLHTFCPPDENGYCNVGSYGLATTSTVLLNEDIKYKKKFAFIDSTGLYPSPTEHFEDGHVHVTEFDYIIESDSVMMPIPAPQPTEVDIKIASFILPYIKGGDIVQIGYGGLGEYILSQLDNIPGTFEIFSEVYCDSMIPLMESGKITKLRAANPSACSEETFKWIAETDKDFLQLPRTQTIDPLSIMQNDNMVGINATFMVDLLGQACSEAQGLTPYSGQGGSFAYIYGSMRSKGGRNFLCLRSVYTDKAGEAQSNIVPWLPAGCIVTTLKNYVMFVVSEWGLADVYLKCYTDRIKALIKIAHPDFRPWLKEQILTTTLIDEKHFEGYDMFDDTPPAVRQPYNMLPPEQFLGK